MYTHGSHQTHTETVLKLCAYDFLFVRFGALRALAQLDRVCGRRVRALTVLV